jgi:hypothetical protein
MVFLKIQSFNSPVLKISAVFALNFEKFINFDFYKSLSFSYYVSGVADTMMGASYICIPEGVNSGQIFGIVKKYIKNNGDFMGEKAEFIFVTTLIMLLLIFQKILFKRQVLIKNC